MIWTARKPDARSATLPAAMPPVRLEFVYDYMSRRCVKHLFDKSGEGAAAVGGSAVVEGSAAAVVQSDEEPVAPESGGGVVIPIGWTLTSTFKFVWDGWNLLAELDGEDGVLRTCAWGLDLSGSEQGAGGVGGLVFQYLAKTDTAHHLFYDGNGNVTSLRDDAGALSCEYVYGPFGETLTARGDEAALAYGAFRFSTKYADAESGLLYYGYRYYNPGTGRWLSRDPIGEAGGIALYTFVTNTPLTTLDALGHRPFLATFSGINNYGRDYVAAALRSRGMTVDYSWHSNLGTDPGFYKGSNLVLTYSRTKLDREATEESEARFGAGAACKPCPKSDESARSTFRVFMIAPKTHTRPSASRCCDVDITVFWSPDDGVPNQGPGGGRESEAYWSQWGTVRVVGTYFVAGRFDGAIGPYPNHDLDSFLADSAPRLVAASNTRQTATAQPYHIDNNGGHWNYGGRANVVNWIESAMATTDEHVWVCHSQGCNMAMHSLNRVCTP